MGHDFFVITVFFFLMCLGTGRPASIGPRLSPTGHIVASKLSGCLNPCYFSWTAFSSGSARLCFLKAVRPDSHLHSGSMNLHTHLRVLFLCRSVGRKICLCKAWIQEAAVPIIQGCVLWDFSGLESACRVLCDPAG